MKIKIIVIMLLSLILTGCYNYNELNELAIANALAIDYKDNKYIVSILMANSHKSASNTDEDKASTSLFRGEGKSIDEAIESLELTLPKKLYLGHVNIIVLDYNYAKKGIDDFFSFVTKNAELMKKVYVVVAKDIEAYKILSTSSPLEMFSSKNIISNIETTNKSVGTIYNVNLTEMLAKYLTEGVDFIIPTVTIIGDKNDVENDSKNVISKSYLKVLTFAIFKDDKLVDITNENESKGINILTDYITNLRIIEDNFSVTLKNIKCKINYKDNEIAIKVNFSYTINYLNDINITNLEEKKKLTKRIENIVNSYINETINLSINNNSDIIGFGNKIYKKSPNYFKNKKDYLSNIKFNIKINGHLESIGTSKNLKEKKM